MPKEQIIEIILDALKDSGLVFAFVFLFHLILSFIDNGVANFLVKHKKSGPLFGSLFGLIPQCGTSVLGAELYVKKYITIGTLTAVFLSCSDEALIAILTSGKGDKMLMVLPLIGLKFAIGFIAGMVMDMVFSKQVVEDVDHVEEEHECHEHHHENTPIHKHFTHPLIHSLKIFAYVLVINLVLGFTIGLVGEDNFTNFIRTNKYLAPLFSPIIGLIPNCASSLLLAELFVGGNLSFGALTGGLLVNSGLGFLFLIRNKKSVQRLFTILAVTFAISVITAYLICLVSGF